VDFSVGYPFSSDNDFADTVLKYSAKIREVYFPWAEIPSGRGTVGESGGAAGAVNDGAAAFELQSRMLEDLTRFADAGIQLNLLINGNCYGRFSQSRAFFNKIGNAVDFLGGRTGLQSITTTSPLVSKFIKANFPEIETRASINMEIGSTRGMDYIKQYFDGFYLQREHNRNIRKIESNKRWCDDNGKKLYLLANSGCLNHCSVHNFHDNLVAHEAEIQAMDNAYEFKGVCHEYLSRKENLVATLRDTNFIRPEDIHYYEPYFSVVKLATRSNRNPARVIEAYVRGKYSGNLLELMEPDHSADIYPFIIDNTKFPEMYGKKRMECGLACENCGYCEAVLKQCAVDVSSYAQDSVF